MSNRLGADFWNLWVQYFVLAWTFDGHERVGFTWWFKLGIFAVGFGGLLVLVRARTGT
jgi:hypothetical protein